MTYGSTIHDELQSKAEEIEREYDSLDKKVRGIESNIGKLVNEREDCFAKIANIYLPNLTANSLKSTLKEKQARLQSIFQEKQSRIALLNSGIEKIIKEKKEYQEILNSTTKELNEVADKRDELRAEVDKKIKENPDHKEKVTEAGKLSDLIALNVDRLKTVKKEYSKKLKEYDSNRIFSYLNNKGFGSDKYNASKLIKKLDKWIAKKVNFNENKENYDFLISMPELMEIELKRRQDKFQELGSEAKRIVDAYVVEVGLDKIIEKGTTLGQKRDELMEDIATYNHRHQEHLSELKSLENTKGEYHKKALSELKDFLKNNTIKDLKKKAKDTTETHEDDKAVYRIEEIDKTVKELKNNAKHLISKKNTLSDKLSEFNDMISKFTRNDYESNRSRFKDGLDIDDLFTGYMKGNYDIGDIWNEIDDNQYWKARSSYSSSSYTSSSSSSWGSSSGFGGGGFSSGGGFGGGGFSSGSGF